MKAVRASNAAPAPEARRRATVAKAWNWSERQLGRVSGSKDLGRADLGPAEWRTRARRVPGGARGYASDAVLTVIC